MLSSGYDSPVFSRVIRISDADDEDFDSSSEASCAGLSVNYENDSTSRRY